MNTEDAIKTLRGYNKWRRGKGKKYAALGMPFCDSEVGVAIDYAVETLKKAHLDEKDMLAVGEMVESFADAMKRAKNKLPESDMRAIKSVRRICRFIKKD